jgi:hypothetical protein
MTRCTHKHFRADFSLQLPDLHADCSLRYVYSQGPGSERARFGDGHEGAQLSNFHNKLPDIKMDYRNNKIF